MEIKFNSVNELYSRLIPALKYKQRELKKEGCDYITYNDVWNYLKKTKWIKGSNLHLYEMINDVMKVNLEGIEKHVKNTLRIIKRDAILEEE